MLLYGHDMNILELLTIMVALKLWGTALRGQRVIISCDNEDSVFALNSGRSRTPGMQLCLREIWFLSDSFDFEIRSDHVPRGPQRHRRPLKPLASFSQSRGSFRGVDIWHLNHFRPMPF